MMPEDNATLDALAGEFLRDHRHGVDTSEAYDDLRHLLSHVRMSALDEAAAVLVEEQSRGGRVMDFDSAVNAPAMIARIRALKLRAGKSLAVIGDGEVCRARV